MSVQTPSELSGPDLRTRDDVEGGVIEDARARQRKHRALGAALLAALVVAGMLVFGFGGGGGSGGGHPGDQRGGGLGPSRQFRLLGGQQQVSMPALPRWVTSSFNMGFDLGKQPSPVMQYGLDLSAARGTALRGGVKVWVVPGRSESCLVTEGPNSDGAGCTTNTSWINHGDERYSYYRAKHGQVQRVTGIAPDGARVTFRLSDGSSIPAQLNSEDAYTIVRPLSDSVVATTVRGHGQTITSSAAG